MERLPQAKENVRVARRQLSDRIRHEVDRVNSELEGHGRVLVRPSGTEPVIRVLAEAETDESAAALCASISALVQQELG
jgi:phosphoglucosamine mutase